MQPGNSSSKLCRNLMEKRRRMETKEDLSRLASLMIGQTSKETLSTCPLLDQVTTYVKQLKENVEELKKKKDKLMKSSENSVKDNTAGLMLPVLAVRDMGSNLEVNLITGMNKKLMLSEIISVLEDEAAEVVSASYSTVGDKIIYAIQSQAICSRIGIETSRVQERLMRLAL